jgi:hypothetical protein
VKCELRGGYAEIEKEQMENPIIAIAAQTFSPSEKTKINSLVKQLCEGDFVGAVTSMNEIEQQVSRPALSKASFEGLRSYALAVSAFYKELMPGVCSNGIDLHTTEGIARLGALGKDPTIAKLKELQEQAKVAMIRSGVGQTADSPSKEEISEAQVAFFNQASPSLNEKVNKFAEDDLCGIAQIAPEQIANALKLPAHQAKIVLRSLLSGN